MKKKIKNPKLETPQGVLTLNSCRINLWLEIHNTAFK